MLQGMLARCLRERQYGTRAKRKEEALTDFLLVCSLRIHRSAFRALCR